MKNNKQILLLGPGASTKRFKPSDVDKITTISFSGNIDWFASNNISCDYWTFLDPNSTLYFLENIKSGVYSKEWLSKIKNNTTLLYNTFQGTDDFYNKGFTTSRGKQWNTNIFGGEVLPELGKYFKDVNTISEYVNNNSYDSHYIDRDASALVKHILDGTAYNTDKFICFVLPIVISLFPELYKVYSVGFGDFNEPRINTGTTLGYEGFILSYNRMKTALIDLLKHNNIELEFINKNTYFKDLEWKK